MISVNIINHKFICFLCNSNKTNLKNGMYELWYNYNNNKICHKCYLKTKGDRNPNRKKQNDKHNKNKLWFKYKSVLLNWNPRTNYCSNCGVYDERTHMHHSKGYYIIFPWFGTIELCNSCHRKIETSINQSERVCLSCGSDTTYRKKDGRYDWFRFNDGFICKKCYRKELKNNGQ